MLVVAIDGACRRNGKPNCVSAGGTFIMHYKDQDIVSTKALTNYEIQSTNQRGELLALLTALDYVWEVKDSAQVITDSEYLFNAMTKEWCKNWQRKGWITATGEPVKNKDIWLEIINSLRHCEDAGLEIAFYHIKGHSISFGEVTAQTLLASDLTGYALYKAVEKKANTVGIRPEIFQHISDLSVKNNGFNLDTYTLNRFMIANTVADAVATKCVNAADALM